MQPVRTLLLVLLSAGLAVPAGAQLTVTGTVRDAASGRPLDGVHVFIAASMMGTTTAADGSFQLHRVPEGAHRLIVTRLGYAAAERELLVRPTTTDPAFEIALAPAVLLFDEITVTAVQDRRWAKRLRRFERLFLGESEQAEQCRILNPEVLSFDGKWWGKLVAQAAEPLVVENRALGYRLTYFLREFEYRGTTLRYDGEPLFEELEPTSTEEAARWAANREVAFYGSFRHFLLALLDGATREHGFRTYVRRPTGLGQASTQSYPLKAASLLRDGPSADEKVLRFRGLVEIEYLDEAESDAFHRWQGRLNASQRGHQRSFIRLTDGPTLVDRTGEIIDPYGVTTYGYFAFERIAEMLPKEYRPSGL